MQLTPNLQPSRLCCQKPLSNIDKVCNCLQVAKHQPVKYELFPLSPLSRHRLSIVRRKVLVLDLDETLIHSHHDGVVRQTVKPGTPPDFVLKVVIDRHPVRFFVHKRPHVDFFLDIVSSTGNPFQKSTDFLETKTAVIYFSITITERPLKYRKVANI
ncbi:Hypothetical predicted protein [Cloeon dipterum]|uniref:FCP1 homology domain-containing protein n=1 Tax=Cloeon dipterum TaxID=197152 RepID=A0A8S1CNH2_9INSE|nr:Hypothetical predicted protein [Cloeon dipterum]